MRILVLMLLSGYAYASMPWLDTDNIWIRSDLQRLADSGVVSGPTSTWPNMWSGIARDLHNKKSIDNEKLLLHYTRVKNQFKKQLYKKQHFLVKLHASNEHQLLMPFGEATREKVETSFETHYLGKQWSYRLKLTRTLSAQDGDDNRLDNSYLSGTFYNWALTAGMVDRWWGPGWNNSLILSNNARPIPAVMLHRNDYKAFETPWLSWLGPWQFVFFMGMLEESRPIANTLVWGARFNLRPFKYFEMGVSRVAQWGGDNRSHSFNTFLKSLAGKDNRDTPSESEPGNQLAGFDFRLHYSFSDHTIALYSQIIGEDEAGGLPSKHLFQLGAEYAGYINSTPYRIYLEYNDTAVRVNGFSDHEFNVAYEHGTYRGGYRYKGRAIGSTYDNDAETLTLGVITSIATRHHFHAELSFLDLNRDDATISANTVSRKRNELFRTSLRYRYISKIGLLQLGMHINSDEIQAKQFDLEPFQLSIDWQYEL